MDLKGKVAIITGSAQGIGREIAELYSKHNGKVVIADLNLQEAKKTAAEIAEKYQQPTLAVEMDVTNKEQVDQGVAETVKKFGQVDILVSNAGIQIISPLIDFDEKKWKKVIEIHLIGGFLTSQACMRAMSKSGGGSIIFMGSVHSVEASKNKSAYVAAKHGLMGLMRAIAKEGAEHNIRANLIGPGFVKTALVEKQIPEQAKSLHMSEEDVVKKVMLGETVDGEFTTTNDVAETALFLAAFPTNALTGQSLLVSHGWHMQ